MMRRLTGLFVALCALTACADHVQVTYNCVPEGAQIYEEGIGQIGTCPLVAKYSPYDKQVNDDHLHTDRMRIVWVSGTSLLVPPTDLLLTDGQATVTFMHPPNTLNSGLDQNYGITYAERLDPPAEKWIVSTGQYHDFFDDVNNNVTCTFMNAFGTVGTECR